MNRAKLIATLQFAIIALISFSVVTGIISIVTLFKVAFGIILMGIIATFAINQTNKL